MEVGAAGGTNRGSRISNSPASTATKLSPLRKKHAPRPACAIRKPATAGPTTRAPLKTELLSDTAFIKSSRLVISTTKAWRAGMSNAMATPPSAASTMMCQGRTSPLPTSAANTNASTIMPLCVKSSTVRLGCRSATDPPHIENSSIGAEPTAATMPSRSFEPVS